MQHIHTPTSTPALSIEGHSIVWRTVKYLSLAVAGLIAVFEHSPGFLIVLAVAVAMALALSERTNSHRSGSRLNPQAPASRLLGDGGSFLDIEPEKVRQESEPPRVLDGGSL